MVAEVNEAAVPVRSSSKPTLAGLSVRLISWVEKRKPAMLKGAGAGGVGGGLARVISSGARGGEGAAGGAAVGGGIAGAVDEVDADGPGSGAGGRWQTEGEVDAAFRAVAGGDVGGEER